MSNETATWEKFKAHCPSCGEVEYDDFEKWLDSKHFTVGHILWWKIKRKLDK